MMVNPGLFMFNNKCIQAQSATSEVTEVTPVDRSQRPMEASVPAPPRLATQVMVIVSVLWSNLQTTEVSVLDTTTAAILETIFDTVFLVCWDLLGSAGAGVGFESWCLTKLSKCLMMLTLSNGQEVVSRD